MSRWKKREREREEELKCAKKALEDPECRYVFNHSRIMLG